MTTDEAIVYDLDRAAAALSVSRRTLATLLSTGQLAFTKIGKRTFVRRATLEDFAKQSEIQFTTTKE
jgi:excisionase family DNA binding protein